MSETNAIKYSWDYQAGRITYVRCHLLNLTRPELSKLIGISHSSLVFWEKPGTNRLTFQSATKMINIFESFNIVCEMNWLLRGEGDPPFQKSTSEKTFLDLPEDVSALEETSLFIYVMRFLLYLYPRPTYLTVYDDSMHPFFKVGQIVFGRKCYQKEIDVHCVNRYCIVQTPDNQELIRTVTQTNIPGVYRLDALNQTHYASFETSLNYAAPVEWHYTQR